MGWGVTAGGGHSDRATARVITSTRNRRNSLPRLRPTHPLVPHRAPPSPETLLPAYQTVVYGRRTYHRRYTVYSYGYTVYVPYGYTYVSLDGIELSLIWSRYCLRTLRELLPGDEITVCRGRGDDRAALLADHGQLCCPAGPRTPINTEVPLPDSGVLLRAGLPLEVRIGAALSARTPPVPDCALHAVLLWPPGAWTMLERPALALAVHDQIQRSAALLS